MTDLDTLLFAVGIAIFMITVYGVVMAGGFALQRQQREDLAPDVEIITNDDGFEVMVSKHDDRSRPTDE